MVGPADVALKLLQSSLSHGAFLLGEEVPGMEDFLSAHWLEVRDVVVGNVEKRSACPQCGRAAFAYAVPTKWAWPSAGSAFEGEGCLERRLIHDEGNPTAAEQAVPSTEADVDQCPS